MLLTDKKKASGALKKFREEIAAVMQTEEFRERSLECRGYCPNEKELEVVCKSGVSVSEPWVRQDCIGPIGTEVSREKRCIFVYVRNSASIGLGYASVLALCRWKVVDSIFDQIKRACRSLCILAPGCPFREGKNVSLRALSRVVSRKVN